MPASILSLLTWGGCIASEHIPQETWDEMLFHDAVDVGLWIAPVYLLKKYIFISYTHFLVVQEVDTLIQTT